MWREGRRDRACGGRGTPPPSWEKTPTLAHPSPPPPLPAPEVTPGPAHLGTGVNTDGDGDAGSGRRSFGAGARSWEGRGGSHGPRTKCTSRGNGAWRLGALAVSASPTGRSHSPQARGAVGAGPAGVWDARRDQAALQEALSPCPGPDAQCPGACGRC